MDGETLGERIAALRKAAGLSQSQLAERAGVSTGTLKNWEQGIRMPLPVGLAAIARGLGVSPGPLLEGVSFPIKGAREPQPAPKPGPGRPRKPEQAPAPSPSGEELKHAPPESKPAQEKARGRRKPRG